jgi:heme oxygenase
MLTQLDFATRSQHMHADAGRLALLSGPLSREKYEDYLTRVFAFEAPIEARWQRTEGLDSIVDVKSRLRAPFLITDLSTLGVRPPETVNIPSFVGVEQALGWMYVVERGRRMNALLHRHLSRRLPPVLMIAGNYLHHSSPCGVRWQQFGQALDRFADNHVVVDQIINAANRAFRSLRPERPRGTGVAAA